MVDVKKMGRPTKYKKEFCQDLMDYISVNPYEKEFDKTGGEPEKTPKFPTVQAFANSIGIHMHTVQNWKEKHIDFLASVKKAECYQAQYLIEAASAGFIDRGFAVFMAKNLTEWNDRGKSDFINSPIHDIEKTSDRIEKIISSVSSGSMSLDHGTKLMAIIRNKIDVDIEEIKRKQEELEKRIEKNESGEAGHRS